MLEHLARRGAAVVIGGMALAVFGDQSPSTDGQLQPATVATKPVLDSGAPPRSILPFRRSPLGDQPDFLPVNEAFNLTARLDGQEAVFRWDMPEGYYLYRHAFAASTEGQPLADMRIPDGKQKSDEFFGDTEVYYNGVDVTVSLATPATTTSAIEVAYQGCADYGLCYPPQKRLVTFGAKGGVPVISKP